MAGTPVDESGAAPLAHERWGFVPNGFVENVRVSCMGRLRAALRNNRAGAPGLVRYGDSLHAWRFRPEGRCSPVEAFGEMRGRVL